MKIKVIFVTIVTAIVFTGCLGDIASMVGDLDTIASTGMQGYNMIQETEVSGSKNKNYSNKEFKSLKSVAIKFDSSGEWWLKGGSGFADNVESQLMKIGLDTYKYGNTDKTFEAKDTQSIRSMAKSLKKENIQALVSGTVTTSHKLSSTFGGNESTSLITAVTFSLVDTTHGKTMATVSLNYKKGVSSIEASKSIARALKALIEYPEMNIEKAFKKVAQ